MKTQPIPTTAKLPVEYTPFPQDAAAHIRHREPILASLERELKALTGQRDAEHRRINEGLPDHLRKSPSDTPEMRKLQQRIFDEKAMLEERLTSIQRLYPQPMSFVLQVPTSVEREQINSRLISLGLSQVTQGQTRATMIEELFEQDWGKGTPAANEAEAENIANFLDGVWMRQEAHDAAVARWQEQEAERVLDEMAGAPARVRADLPPKIISVREQAKLALLIDRMMGSSQKLRDLAARQTDFNRLNAFLLVRMHVLSAKNVDLVLERDPHTRALPDDQAVALREKVDDASWHDLVSYIDRMYKLDGGEEKNSDLPLEKPFDPTGSIGPSGGTDSSGGNSTISSISPAPAGGSEMTIASSSPSTFDHEPAPASMTESASPMAEA